MTFSIKGIDKELKLLALFGVPNHVSGMVLQAVADSFVTAFAIAAVTAFIAAITPAWLAVAGVVLLGVGVAVMANIPEESVPDWLKPVKKGADGIADKAVKMLKEGPASVVEDIGQGLMDEIQTPEGIASVAGGTVGTLAGGYAGSRVNSALKTKIDKKVGKADNNKNISVDDLTNNLVQTKPKNSPNPQKWLDKGGEICVDKDGVWSYTNGKGQSVKYPDGYPDFKRAGLVKQEVDIGAFKDYVTDFKKADSLAPNGPRDAVNNTWHHSQDGHTLQEVDKAIHKEFTHRGGMSLKKKK